MKRLTLYSAVALLATVFLSCAKKPSSDEVLSAAIHKINEHQAFRYKYISHWDTRANESTFADSAQIIYSKLDSSYHGFGFYVNNYKWELLFDGINYYEIRHPDEMIVRHDTSEIKTDSSYFAHSMFFFASPFELKSVPLFNYVRDTVINNQHYYIYINITEQSSVEDTTQTVRIERHYYIDSDAALTRRIQNITLIDQDTAQIIEYRFDNIHFDELAYNFANIEYGAALQYREIGIHELDNEQYLQQITKGDRLNKRSYKDFNGQNIPLYGDANTQTLIMFSFIGCGGCEYAMREMKKKNYNIRPGLKLYYSSPYDKAATLLSYLKRKEFPFTAFAKESQMNEDFSVVAFPTFVLIDTEGVVTKVLSGYNEELQQIIFGSDASR